MGRAQEKAERLGLKNVDFRQGDVGNMPFEDNSFDVVLSINGFHAFPDKDAAYRETFRVLKSGGTLLWLFLCVRLLQTNGLFHSLPLSADEIFILLMRPWTVCTHG